MIYYGHDLNGASLPFNFLLLQCPWNAQAVAQIISEYMTTLLRGAWPTQSIGGKKVQYHTKTSAMKQVAALGLDINGEPSVQLVTPTLSELVDH